MNSTPTEETVEKDPRSTQEFYIPDVCNEMTTDKKGFEKQGHQQELSLIHGGNGVKDLDSAASSPARDAASSPARKGSASVPTAATENKVTRGLRRTPMEWEAKAAARQERNAAMKDQQLLTTATRNPSKEVVQDNATTQIKAMKNEDQQKEFESGEFNVMDVAVNNEETGGLAEETHKSASSQKHAMNTTDSVVAPEPPKSTERQPSMNLVAPKPGAYSGAPGEGFQRRDDMRFSLLGVVGAKGLSQSFLEDKRNENATHDQFNQDNQIFVDGGDRAGLAEASPVEDGVEPHMEAQPFDMDESEKRKAKVNSIYTAKLALMTILVLAIVATVLGLVLKNSKKDAQPTHTSAPTSYRSSLLAEFESKILETFRDDYWDEENDLLEVRKMALDWIVNEDPMQLEVDADNLIQRYILTVFYFQTSQASNWTYCGAGSADPCYFSTVGDRDKASTLTTAGIPWLTNNHECLWATIACDGNRSVEEIRMFDNGLHSSLPTELAWLNHLKKLSLTGNDFTGPIPTYLSELTALNEIDFGRNKLTGEINWMVFEPMQHLQNLSLYQNSFTGTIAKEIGRLKGLKQLWLYDIDGLNGPIPSEIGELSLLENLILTNNGHFGPLPSEIGLLTNLEELLMAKSNMGGSTIPEEFWNMSSAVFIDFNGAGFGGTISTSIGKMTTLRGLKASRNSFSGTLPSEIGLLDDLQLLWVHVNPYLRGEVPLEICSLRGPEGLMFLNADCATKATSGARIDCPMGCCTGCCDEHGQCQVQ